MKHILPLLFALVCIAGVLALLDILMHLWILWVIPLFEAYPATVCFGMAGVVMSLVFLCAFKLSTKN